MLRRKTKVKLKGHTKIKMGLTIVFLSLSVNERDLMLVNIERGYWSSFFFFFLESYVDFMYLLLFS